MNFRILIILFLFFYSVYSCKREYIGDYNADFVGEWHSDTMTMTNGEKREIYFIINGENSEYGFMCNVFCGTCSCQLLTSGKAVINRKKNKMIIGSGNGNPRVRVRIRTFPYQEGGKWKCVIEDSHGTPITMYKR